MRDFGIVGEHINCTFSGKLSCIFWSMRKEVTAGRKLGARGYIIVVLREQDQSFQPDVLLLWETIPAGRPSDPYKSNLQPRHGADGHLLFCV